MKKWVFLFATALLATTCQIDNTTTEKRPEAGKALGFWALSRMYPDGKLHSDQYARAYEMARNMSVSRGPLAQWEAIGPMNIGGRSLSLAIHPTDSNILFLGSAAGGLWKSTTEGKGPNAWQRIETGFPVLGVGAIAIHPSNPEIMYIGTGEVYNLENSMPNIAFRTTRGTYGMGILKSTDGGTTWFKSLDWSYQDLTGVQEIRINPLRPETVWAATTQGLLRSYNAGATWETVLNIPMAVDLEITPSDTNKIFVTFGSLEDNDISGIYRSLNGGASFDPLESGLPTTYSGKALLSIAPSNHNIIFVSVGNAFAQEGLYKSTNGGNSFTKINTTDVSKYQGWYSHDIAIKPDNPQQLVWGGIDNWLSFDGGANFMQATYWYEWFFGQVPVGGPEGPDTYVHADIHRLQFHPQNPNKVFAITDGGLFISNNAGGKWEGRNGGYQTQQFYANFSNSASNPLLALGGMQDNATAVYTGSPAWTRGIGGDGCCTAIHPFEDQIMLGSAQYGYLQISGDAGQNWSGFPTAPIGTDAAFVAPFEYAPSNPDILYLGENILEQFDFNTQAWTALTPPGNLIIALGINPTDENDIYYTTAPGDNTSPAVYHVDAATQAITQMQGLPNRMFTDITRHPTDKNIVYAICGGFGTSHVWQTTNGGNTWTAIDNGIPDIPTNSLLVDPLQPNHLYLANDIGVWFSENSGQSWVFFSAEGPQAMLAMHLSISADRQLRVATHGLGVFQTPMVFEPANTTAADKVAAQLDVFPNPVKSTLTIRWKGEQPFYGHLRWVDLNGKTVWENQPVQLLKGSNTYMNLERLSPGAYIAIFENKGLTISKRVIKQ